MTKVKKQDFVEIEYTGKLKEEDMVFDTSDEKLAKESGLFNQEHNYGPIKIMVGGSQVLPGLDRFMEGKEPGEYNVTLDPTDGFGKKNPHLLKLMPKKIFTQQQINPMPGLPVNIDGMNGVVKTVSGGRCIVDFNHPLSGKELVYDLKINKIITDEKEKVESIMELQAKKGEFDVNLEGEKATITLKNKNFKQPLKDLVTDMIKKFTKVKTVEFKDAKDSKQEDKK
jgi:FKBP-type peptidyl-prolyl cis-trans isomerase 2